MNELKYYAPRDNQNELYVIIFDDADVDNEVYTDEAAAIKRYEMLQANWNCFLLELKKTNQ